MEKQLFRVTVKPCGASFDCYSGESVLAASQASGLALASNCQRGECGSCKVRIKKGRIKLAPFMLSALSMAEIDADYTLACRSYPLTDLEIVSELVGRQEARHYPRKDSLEEESE